MQVRALDKGKYSTDYCTKEAHISVVNIQQQAVYPGGTCESLVKPDMIDGGRCQPGLTQRHDQRGLPRLVQRLHSPDCTVSEIYFYIHGTKDQGMKLDSSLPIPS